MPAATYFVLVSLAVFHVVYAIDKNATFGLSKADGTYLVVDGLFYAQPKQVWKEVLKLSPCTLV
jgi:hypothetical protein